MYVSHSYIFPQKFENLALVVSQTEEPHWDFMCEESNDQSDILAVVHLPKWFSKRMRDTTVIGLFSLCLVHNYV